jgi:hypothetical protein
MKTSFLFSGILCLSTLSLFSQEVSTLLNTSTAKVDDALLLGPQGIIYGSHYNGSNVYKIDAAGNAQVFATGGGRLARTYQGVLKELSSSVSSKELDLVGIRATRVHAALLVAVLGKIAYGEILDDPMKKVKDSYHFVGTLRRHIDYMAELAEIAATCTDAQELFDFIVNATVMLTKVDACVLRVLDEQKKKLHLASSFGVGNDWQGKATIPLAKSLIEKAFSLGTPLKVISIIC